jgi:hypothetical protein
MDSKIKYKIGLTISADTLFGLIAKFLPIEDLSVQEIVNKPETKQSEMAKLIAKNMPKITDKLEAPKPKLTMKQIQRTRFNHPSGKRVFDFIVEFIEKQPDKTATYGQMGHFIMKQGFSKSSINNGLTRLVLNNVIRKTDYGVYTMVNKK